MADVGVLSLEIQANSGSAESSLKSLVGALEAIKAAVNGSGLGRVANALKRLGDAVSVHTVTNLNGVASALQRIQAACNFTVPSLSGLKKAMEYMDSMANAQETTVDLGQAAQGAADAVNTAFLSAAQSVAIVTMSVEDLKASLDFSQFDPANLPLFSLGTHMDEESIKMLRWGAMVRDSYESVRKLGDGRDIVQGVGTVQDEMGNVVATVGNATEAVNGATAATENWLEQARAINQQFAGLHDTINSSLEEKYNSRTAYGAALRGDLGEKTQIWAIKEEARATKTTVEEVRQQIEALKASANSAKGPVQDLMNTLNSPTGNALSSQSDAMRSISDAAGAAEPKLEKMHESGDVIAKAFGSVQTAVRGVGEAITSTGIWQLGSRLFSIARYRMLRAIIKEIANGIKEGFENYKNYSNKVGNKFSKEISNVNAQFTQLKNSMGAAIAPALSAAIPVIQSIASAATSACNAVNQLISLLSGGSSWTRATNNVGGTKSLLSGASDAASDMKDNVEQAKKSTKDLLADWDELNIIQSSSGGGGGGGSGDDSDDFLSMFEQVNEFDSKIRALADFLRGNMEELLGVAQDVGIAILAWKLSKGFTGVLSSLLGLVAAGKTIEITLKLTEMFDEEYVRTGDEGWLIADLVTNLVGATLAGTIVGSILGGEVGIITAGISMVVSAGITYGIAVSRADEAKQDAMTKLAAVKFAIGAAAMALGFGVATGSGLLGLAMAAMVAVPMFALSAGLTIAVKQFETAEEIAQRAFAQSGEGGVSVDEIYKSLQDLFTEASSGYSIVIDSFSGVPQLKANLTDALVSVSMLTGIIRGDGKLTQAEAEEFKQAWQTVFSAFENITADSFSTIFNGLNKSLASENEIIAAEAKKLRIELLAMEKGITTAMAEAEDEMNQLADKVALGKANETELNRYFTMLEAMGATVKTSYTNFEDFLKSNKNIDFGDAEHAVDNAAEFIKNVAEGAKTAISEIDTGLQTEMSALDTAWNSVEMLHKIGNITDEQYQMYKTLFEQTRDNFQAAADSEKDKVTTAANDAYRSVIEQALESLNNIPGILTDSGDIDIWSFSAFFTSTLAPLLFAAKDAGLDLGEIFGEEFAASFGEGISLQEWLSGENGVSALLAYIKENYLTNDNTEGVAAAARESAAEAAATVGDLQEATSTATASVQEDVEALSNQTVGEINNEPYINSLKETAQSTQEQVESTLEEVQKLNEPWWKTDTPTYWWGGTEEQMRIFKTPEVDKTPEMQNEVEEAVQETARNIEPVEVELPIKFSYETDLSGLSQEAQSMVRSMEAAMELGYDMQQLGEQLNANRAFFGDDAFIEALPVLQEMMSAYREHLDTSGITEPMQDAADASSQATESIVGDVATLSGQSVGGVDGSAMISSLSALSSSVWSYVNSILNGLSQLGGASVGSYAKRGLRVTAAGHYPAFASGGFPDSGSIFMADENGDIELKGRMGSQPVVANNQQIIAGISEGVTKAQSGQNSLLARQNELLMQILHKSGNAVVTASSQIGRVNARSNRMYERVTGG